MKYAVLSFLFSVSCWAGSLPIEINSLSREAPAQRVYQANRATFRVSFRDGTNRASIAGHTPAMWWAASSTASGISTSSYAIVDTNLGIVDFTFSPQALNTNGNGFVYGAGFSDTPQTFRIGSFTILPDPSTGATVSGLLFTAGLNWDMITVTGTSPYYSTSNPSAYTTTGYVGAAVAAISTPDLQAVLNAGVDATNKDINVKDAYVNSLRLMPNGGDWTDSDIIQNTKSYRVILNTPTNDGTLSTTQELHAAIAAIPIPIVPARTNVDIFGRLTIYSTNEIPNRNGTTELVFYQDNYVHNNRFIIRPLTDPSLSPVDSLYHQNMPLKSGTYAMVDDITNSTYYIVTNIFTSPTPPPPPPSWGTATLTDIADVSNNVLAAIALNDVQSTNAATSVSHTWSASQYSSVDHTTTTPAGNEYPTADWVRGLAMSGAPWYLTTNRVTLLPYVLAKATNSVYLSSDAVSSAFTNAIVGPTNGQYLSAGVTTQSYTAVRGPVSFEMYLSLSGGNPASAISVHPEVYYFYNGGSESNLLGDWEVANQTVTATMTTPTRFLFTVAFPEPTITGSVRVVGALRCGGVAGAAATLNLIGGGIYPSHMDIPSAAAGTSDGGATAGWFTNTAVVSYDATNRALVFGTNAFGGGESIGSLRAEVDDLRYRASISDFIAESKSTAYSYGTPYGRLSIFASSNDDITSVTNFSYSTNKYWFADTRTFPASWSTSGVAKTPFYGGEARAVTIGDFAYVIGGFSSNVYAYSFASNEYTMLAPVPMVGLQNPNLVTIGNTIYSIGGYTAAADSNCFAMTIPSNIWVKIAGHPTTLQGGQVASVSNRIYSLGGYSGGALNACYVYKPESNNWSNLGVVLPEARYNAGIATYLNDIFLWSGDAGTGTAALKYSTVSNNFTALQIVSASRLARGVAFFGNIFSIGGSSLTTVLSYNIATNRWIAETNLPSVVAGGAVTTYGNAIYVLGGAANSNSYVYKVAISNCSIESSSVSLPFDATRLASVTLVPEAYISRMEDLPSSSGSIGCWTNYFSFDNGTNWTSIAPNRIVGGSSTNAYYSVVTALTAGSSIRHRISVTSGSIFRVQGWSRFGGN